MSEPAVVLSVADDGVALVELNRPERNNAMGRELLAAFADAVARVRTDRRVRVVVISGRGKHFCAGADLQDGFAAIAAEAGGGAAALRGAIRSLYEPFLSVLDIEVPTLAAVRGAAIGGGLGLALACDLRIAAEDARFQANFVRLGIHPGMGVSWFLPHLVGPQRAAELLFTGRLVDGDEAARLGILLEAHATADVMPRALDLARTIAANAPAALRLTKRTFYRGLGWDVRAGARAESTPQAITLGTADAAEGIKALLEKRDPKFTGR